MFLVLTRKSILFFLAGLMGICLLCGSRFASSVITMEQNPRLIVVDAGHGGMDGGCVGINQTMEKDLNLIVAKQLETALKERGYQVIMTRTEDVSLHSDDKKTVREQKNSDLKTRAAIGNRSGAGLFVSIHMNRYEEESVKGAQVFYKKTDETGKTYAETIMEELKKTDSKNHRQSKPLPNKNLLFEKLTIPAVLVECGFLSNPDEAQKLTNSDYQKELVSAIIDGIEAAQ